MGQNLAGFPEITIEGKRGQKVTMLVAEKLTQQGVCDQRQTGRQHYYEYTLGSDGTETWHPLAFLTHGFRYSSRWRVRCARESQTRRGCPY